MKPWQLLMVLSVFCAAIGCGSQTSSEPVTEITADEEAQMRAEQEKIDAAERANL